MSKKVLKVLGNNLLFNPSTKMLLLRTGKNPFPAVQDEFGIYISKSLQHALTNMKISYLPGQLNDDDTMFNRYAVVKEAQLIIPPSVSLEVSTRYKSENDQISIDQLVLLTRLLNTSHLFLKHRLYCNVILVPVDGMHILEVYKATVGECTRVHLVHPDLGILNLGAKYNPETEEVTTVISPKYNLVGEGHNGI